MYGMNYAGVRIIAEWLTSNLLKANFVIDMQLTQFQMPYLGTITCLLWSINVG